ncbi:MAG TPA: hypothetical protein VG672_04770 [Bryobacteraceae bacterium]|nr:hypothetical protein [Bryobacteraceae bacterium]
MKLSVLAAAALVGGGAWAQSLPLPITVQPPISQVKEYLQLTDAQVQSITQNNEEYTRWFIPKQSRIYQVQSELTVETAKDPLDPSALGIRYAEIEMICRQMKTQAADTQTKNVAVLNDAQKTKLAGLTDVLKLLPILAEAQLVNLLSINSASRVPAGVTGAALGAVTIIDPVTGAPSGNRISAILTPSVANISACAVPYPTTVIRNGDFSGIIANPNLPTAP